MNNDTTSGQFAIVAVAQPTTPVASSSSSEEEEEPSKVVISTEEGYQMSILGYGTQVSYLTTGEKYWICGHLNMDFSI